MKQLLYKEWKLCMHPMAIFFLSFSLMLLIPNYWYYVIGFFGCNSLFFLFSKARENDDLYFTATLPVPKRDVVRARVLLVVLLQSVMLVLMALVALFRVLVFPDSVATLNLAGTDVGLTLFGVQLLLFGVFNRIFLPETYRTTSKVGVPFLKGTSAYFLITLLIEGTFVVTYTASLRGASSAFLSVCSKLDAGITAETLPLQACALILGMLLYVGLTLSALHASEKHFERLDL